MCPLLIDPCLVWLGVLTFPSLFTVNIGFTLIKHSPLCMIILLVMNMWGCFHLQRFNLHVNYMSHYLKVRDGRWGSGLGAQENKF